MDGTSGERFALQSGGAVSLHETGFLHPTGGRSRRERFTPYRDLLHLTLGRRTLRFGTRGGVAILPRDRLAESSDAVALAQALLRRVAALPDGGARLAAMEVLDDRMRSAPAPWAARAVTALCAAVFAVQSFSPTFSAEAGFVADTLELHEWWRLFTFQFLHGGLLHLVMNGMGLLLLGGLLERSVGPAACIVLMAASAVGAAAASVLAAYPFAVGASGIVAGIAGALVALELGRPEVLPAPWRLPRRLWLVAGLLDGVLLAFVPGIAHAAHVGGFLAGGALALPLAPRAGDPPLPRAAPAVRLAAWASVALVAVAFVGAGRFAAGGDEALAARADRLLALPKPPAELLNDQAWIIATSHAPSEALLERALELAERAVELTDRRNPNLLDTLAEVHFALGQPSLAVSVIDEAIALDPREPYYREQRKRYTGERDAEDRPPPPGQEPLLPDAPLPEPQEPPDGPGIRV